MKIKKVIIDKADIYPMLYFVIAKYQTDGRAHLQGTSSKNDLLGGFIDRWINRIAEYVLFNKVILKDKKYSVVTDFYLYSNNAEKNAPDILGLKCNTTGKVYKFAEFREVKWQGIIDNPWIEVKTFRDNQKMLSAREGQMNPEHYYLIAQSYLRDDYLIEFFCDEVFDVKNRVEMVDSFIKEDPENRISGLTYISKDDHALGQMMLFGIFKGADLIGCSNYCDQGVSPVYIKDVVEVQRVRGANLDVVITEHFNVDSKIKNLLFKDSIIKFSVINAENIKLKKINKTNFYFKAAGPAKINNYTLTPGKTYKAELSEFSRSSKWGEYISHKNTYADIKDRTDELVNIFDSIYNGK